VHERFTSLCSQVASQLISKMFEETFSETAGMTMNRRIPPRALICNDQSRRSRRRYCRCHDLGSERTLQLQPAMHMPPLVWSLQEHVRSSLPILSSPHFQKMLHGLPVFALRQHAANQEPTSTSSRAAFCLATTRTPFFKNSQILVIWSVHTQIRISLTESDRDSSASVFISVRVMAFRCRV
jgi:hypothetical protein